MAVAVEERRLSAEAGLLVADSLVPSIEFIARVIADSAAPIEDRMRCLFQARHHGGVHAVEALLGAVDDPSVLLVHETAYVLGQLGEPSALPKLIELLEDKSRHCMIRHEAAEAVAAIGEVKYIPLIREYLADSSAAVRETCHLALKSLQAKLEESDAPNARSLFNTVDPIAKVADEMKLRDCESLRTMLLDGTVDLYERYEALFTLRDMKTAEANRVIIDALLEDDTSALFRHEVAFVLGQIQTPDSVTALVKCLGNAAEDPMARHEAALALGSVACNSTSNSSVWNEAVQALKLYSTNPEPVVAESCLVALDNIKQESGGDC